MRSLSEGIVRSLWNFKDMGWRKLLACGTSGDILILWKENLFECVEILVRECTISCLFKDCSSGIR